ncbi:MAG: DsbA family protein [Chloroflexota bacterium]
MPRRETRQRAAPSSRGSGEQTKRWDRRYIWAGAAGAVIVLAVVIGIVVALTQGDDGSPAQANQPHAKGPEDAPVTIVEYADFQCPVCQRFAFGVGQQITDQYVDSGQAQLVFRHLAFLGDESWQAAMASECAAEQGEFWAYHDLLFANQDGEDQGAFNRGNLIGFASGLDLDVDAFTECLDSERTRPLVEEDVEAARELGVNSTPSLVINGDLVTGMQSFSQYQEIINGKLARR